jgi:hypothetical protein
MGPAVEVRRYRIHTSTWASVNPHSSRNCLKTSSSPIRWYLSRMRKTFSFNSSIRGTPWFLKRLLYRSPAYLASTGLGV